MTVKEEYENMKTCFRIWNKNSNFDETKYIMFIEHYTKRSQTMIMKLLKKDLAYIEWDLKYEIMDLEEYFRKRKVLADVERSIQNMTII